MATYVSLIQFTDQGIRNVKDTIKRGEAADEDLEAVPPQFVEWSRGDASDIDWLSREAEMSGSE